MDCLRHKVWMFSDGLFQFLEKGEVCRVAGTEALLIQNVNDSFVPLLNKIANDLIIEVFHRLPLQTSSIGSIIGRIGG